VSREARIAEGVASLLEDRVSRRGFLVRTAIVGCAFAVAPLRYLLNPQSAWATIVRPSHCKTGLCTDGWTEFCCTINNGVNACPPYAFVGGWWKCTDYRGHRLCGDDGVRYYLDCNRLPREQIPGGCHCANGDCANRHVGCTSFRYGQCNTDIAELTEIVCRVVVCEHPASIPDFHCNSTYKENDLTCSHESPCLPVAAPTRGFGW
jgi:hypothetical protein